MMKVWEAGSLRIFPFSRTARGVLLSFRCAGPSWKKRTFLPLLPRRSARLLVQGGAAQVGQALPANCTCLAAKESIVTGLRRYSVTSGRVLRGLRLMSKALEPAPAHGAWQEARPSAIP